MISAADTVLLTAVDKEEEGGRRERMRDAHFSWL